MTSVLQEVGSLEHQRFGDEAGKKAKACEHVLVVNTVKVNLELGIVDSRAMVQRYSNPGPVRCTRLQLPGKQWLHRNLLPLWIFIFKLLTSFRNRLLLFMLLVVQPRRSGQDLGLGLAAPREVCTDPPLQPDEVPLGGSCPSTCHWSPLGHGPIDHPSVFPLFCNFHASPSSSVGLTSSRTWRS